jgi:ELWxxDGT repeat protein
LNEDAEGCERAQPHVVDRTLFIATTHELWKSDGTAAGTVLVKKFKPGLSLWAWRAPVHVGGTLFFHLQGAGIMQLWRSDGTDSGTTLLAEDAPHSLGMAIFPLGQKLLLALEDREHGRELWTSDGTAAGTRLLVDLQPGPEGSWPQGFVEFGDRALFGATTPRDDVPFDPRASLWSTDGTTAGTRRIATQVGSAEMARMGRFVYWIRPI